MVGCIGILLQLLGCANNYPISTDVLQSNSYTKDVFHTSKLAEKAYRESRWTDAARYYQKLTESVPGDAYIWFRLANTYVQKGEFDLAIHAYETSLERDVYQPKPWFNLSSTYLLNARAALLQSWEHLRPGDPARELITRRIAALDTLMNHDINKLRVNHN